MKIEGKVSKASRYLLARRRYNQWKKKKTSKVYLSTLFAMCEGVCPECNRDMILSFNKEENERGISASLDHTIPLSETLEHNKFGLQIMCRDCNSSKENT